MSKTPPPGAIDYEEACALLGLPCSSNPNDIDDDQLKKAFRKAALKAHPDKGGSDDEFRKVKAASECIVRAKKHGISRVNDVIDSDDEEGNFEAFFDEEGDDIMAEIILRMYEMETGRGATGSKRRKIRDLVERLRRSEESKRLEAEKLARVAVAKAQKAKEEQRFWARQEAAGGKSLQEGGSGCYLQWDPRQLRRELQKRRLKPPRPSTVKTMAEELLRDDEKKASRSAASETSLTSPGASPPPTQKKKPVFQRPRDKLRDNRRRKAQEILKQQAAESAERERVETLYVGAGLSLFGLAVLVFFLDFLFYVGFWRCFTPLAAVFGGYFYYALSAEPPSKK